MLDKIRVILWKIASCSVAVAIILLSVKAVTIDDISELIHKSLIGKYNEEKSEDYQQDYSSSSEEKPVSYKAQQVSSGASANKNNFTNTVNEEESYEKYAQPDLYAHMTVYFTKSGECFHIDRDCFHIINRDVGSAEMEDIIDRLRPCEDCSYEVINYYN